MSLTAFFKTRLLPALWLILLMAYILIGTATAPFHGDESTLIYMSRDYDYLFIQRDWGKVLYAEPPVSATEQQLRLLNGVIHKYLVGLARQLNNLPSETVNEQWDWGADWNYNQQTGRAPSTALLLTARAASVGFLAAGVVVMFALGKALGGGLTAYAASLYYALHPALLLNGRRAMMESSFLFFTLLLLLVGVWMAQRPSLARTVLLGIVAGLALASKHTALFSVVTVYLSLLIYLIIQSIRSTDDDSPVDYTILPYLVIAALVTGGVFYALNPAWWGDPLGRAQTVWTLRNDLLAGQTDAFGGYADFSDQLAGFLRQAFMAQPQYYEVEGWDATIGGQIAAYEGLPWRGVSIGGSLPGALALGGLLLIGAWRLLRDHRRDEAARWMIGVWALAMLLTTLLLTPIEWQRYYLPAYPAVGLVAALGCDHVLTLTRQLRSSRSSVHQPAG